ncbi:MAG: hypothetical protein ACRD1R_19215 [Acidobacteriota bacterium]
MELPKDWLETELRLSREELLTSGKIIQLGLPPNRVDLINYLDGVTFSEAWESRVPATFDPLGEVPMIGRSSLIKNKKAVGRHRDQDDLDVLE